MDKRETPLRGGRTIPAIVRIEDSVHRPVSPHSASFINCSLIWKREGFPVRHDFSRLTHRTERYLVTTFRKNSTKGNSDAANFFDEGKIFCTRLSHHSFHDCD